MRRERGNGLTGFLAARCGRGASPAVREHDRHVGYNSVIATMTPARSNHANRQVRVEGRGAARRMGWRCQMGGEEGDVLKGEAGME